MCNDSKNKWAMVLMSVPRNINNYSFTEAYDKWIPNLP